MITLSHDRASDIFSSRQSGAARVCYLFDTRVSGLLFSASYREKPAEQSAGFLLLQLS